MRDSPAPQHIASSAAKEIDDDLLGTPTGTEAVACLVKLLVRDDNDQGIDAETYSKVVVAVARERGLSEDLNHIELIVTEWVIDLEDFVDGGATQEQKEGLRSLCLALSRQFGLRAMERFYEWQRRRKERNRHL